MLPFKLTLCKPCSVLQIYEVAIIYLRLNVRTSLHFDSYDSPTKIWVLACGVYLVSFPMFPSSSVSVALLQVFSMALALGVNSAVKKNSARSYWDRHKHYSHLRLCEHGLSSNLIKTSDCLSANLI